jgi:hypothetical protein
LFSRLYQYTDDAAAACMARTWYMRALAMRDDSVRFGGFFAWNYGGTPHLKENCSLLAGATGCALALLSAVGAIEPRWDRLLLASGQDAET